MQKTALVFGIVTALSAVTGAGLFVMLFYPDLFYKTSELTVPDLTGKPYESAELSDLYQVVQVYEYNDSPAGTVLSQVPAAGTKRTAVPGRRYVTLVLSVSKGPRMEEVPDVSRMTASGAEAALINAGFDVERKEVYSTLPAGTILSQTPEAGSLIKVGTRVELAVSRGPVIRLVTVPDLTGHTETEARGLLDAAGLALGKVQVAFPGEGRRVVRQFPAPGTRLPENRAVNLWIG